MVSYYISPIARLGQDGENFVPEDEYKIPDTDDFSEYDKYINAEVILPRDGERFQSARVVRRVRVRVRVPPTVLGPEFGEEYKGRKALIIRVAY